MNNPRFEDGVSYRIPRVKTLDADTIADERRIEARILRILRNYLRYTCNNNYTAADKSRMAF